MRRGERWGFTRHRAPPPSLRPWGPLGLGRPSWLQNLPWLPTAPRVTPRPSGHLSVPSRPVVLSCENAQLARRPFRPTSCKLRTGSSLSGAPGWCTRCLLQDTSGDPTGPSNRPTQSSAPDPQATALSSFPFYDPRGTPGPPTSVTCIAPSRRPPAPAQVSHRPVPSSCQGAPVSLSQVCPSPTRSPPGLSAHWVKAQVLPVTPKILCHLPCPLLPCSLSSSHTGLLAVPPTHQAWSCPRAFAHAMPGPLFPYDQCASLPPVSPNLVSDQLPTHFLCLPDLIFSLAHHSLRLYILPVCFISSIPLPTPSVSST